MIFTYNILILNNDEVQMSYKRVEHFRTYEYVNHDNKEELIKLVQSKTHKYYNVACFLFPEL